MTTQQDLCRACQLELAFARGGGTLSASQAGHVAQCAQCRSFAAEVGAIARLATVDIDETPPGLVERSMECLRPELEWRARERSWLRVGLVLAGLVSLPVILGVNGSLIWLIYTSLAARVSQAVAVPVAYVVAASTLLLLSITYGSLPLLVEWGLELRRRCHALAASPAGVPRLLEVTVHGRSR